MSNPHSLDDLLSAIPSAERRWNLLSYFLADALADAMEDKGINQSELAEQTHLTDAQVSKLLRTRTNPTLRTISKLECALDRSLLWYSGDDKRVPETASVPMPGFSIAVGAGLADRLDYHRRKIGDRIDEMAAELQMSNGQMATLCGLTAAQVSKIRHGHTNVTLKTICAIEAATGRSVFALEAIPQQEAASIRHYGIQKRSKASTAVQEGTETFAASMASSMH